MARKVMVASGDAGGSTWQTVTNESHMVDLTNDIRLVENTWYYSPTFTAPNTTNACTHLMFIFDQSSSVNSSGTDPDDATITLALEEYDGATWTQVATKSFDLRDIVPFEIDYMNFSAVKLTTPYVFTTTTADYYRVGIQASGYVDSPIIEIPINSNGNMLYCVDDRTSTLSTSDDGMIVGSVGETRTEMTISGDITFKTSTSTFFSSTNIGRFYDGVIGYYNSKITIDDSAGDMTITCGTLVAAAPGSIFECGTSSNRITNNVTFAVTQTSSFTTYIGSYGLRTQCRFYGTRPTLIAGTVASGTGTAADPLLITESVDWNVGDHIVFAPSADNEFDESEYRYIITKNSATSYVLSDTSGGSESALTHPHAGATVANLTRNIRIYKAVSGSNSAPVRVDNRGNVTPTGELVSASTKDDLMVLDAVQCENVEVYVSHGNNIDDNTTVTYSTFDINGSMNAFEFQYNGTLTQSDEFIYDFNIFTDTTNSTLTSAGLVQWFGGAFNTHLRDSYFINFVRQGAEVGGVGCSVERCEFSAMRLTSSGAGALNMDTEYGNFLVADCDFNANYRAFNFATSGVGLTVNNCRFGTLATNVVYDIGASGFSDALFSANFINCQFGNADISVDTDNTQAGVSFDRFNDTEGDYRVITSAYEAVSTGTGLTDTFEFSRGKAGNKAWRIEPKSGGVAVIDFLIPMFASSAVTFFFYTMRNAQMTSTIPVELFLPTNKTSTPDATENVTAGTDENILFLRAANTTTEYGLARMSMSIPYDQSGGYLYMGNFLDGNNNFTGLDIWHEGRPAILLLQDAFDPNAVWSVATGNFADDTTGDFLEKAKRDAGNAATLSA